jgi:hypothetical protein
MHIRTMLFQGADWALTFPNNVSSSSATGPCDGDDGGDGIGVLASFAKESCLFLCLRRVECGDGGGLGGRCSWL